MAYSRIFITLNQCCGDYVKDIRGCIGRCIIELRNGCGRFILQAQGLIGSVYYTVVVLSEDKYAEIAKRLYVGGSGKGEIRCTYNPLETGIAVEDIRAVAVLVKDKAPLVGFTRGEYNWQSLLMANEVRAAEVAADKATVISIIEEIDDNIQEIKSIISSSGEDYIFGREHIKPFGDDGIIWVRGNVRELSAIKDMWKYSNNPFVVNNYNKYGHIIIGKNNNCRFLGIPCSYDKDYVTEARLQGFSNFKPPQNTQLEQDGFCYCIMKC